MSTFYLVIVLTTSGIEHWNVIEGYTKETCRRAIENTIVRRRDARTAITMYCTDNKPAIPQISAEIRKTT